MIQLRGKGIARLDGIFSYNLGDIDRAFAVITFAYNSDEFFQIDDILGVDVV